MSDLEISKTLPQLTPKQARVRTEQNKKIGALGPISLYIHVLQGGLQAENTTMPEYCKDVYGVDVRTGQYWITRVRAMMILHEITEERLLEILTGGEKFPELPPQDVSTEIVKADPGKARLAWDRFQAIRDAPSLAVKGNGASFKRLLGHGETEARGELNSPLRDQKQPEIVISPPVETAPNTQYTGPWCEACGDKCKTGEVMCDDCIADAVSADPMPEESTLRFDPERQTYVDEEGNDAGHPIPPDEEEDRPNSIQVEPEAYRPPPMKSIAVLTVCSATKTGGYPEVWTLRLTDGNGYEHTAVLSQKVLDLAPIK